MNNHSTCPFCRQNNLLTAPVIAETDGAFLIEASKHPGNFLIIPAAHTETPAELPNDWWKSVATLLTQVPVTLDHYNISLNIGEHSGQTVNHLHFWVVPRQADAASSGKGLTTLVQNADAQK